jgi:GIY-YIG catalytic domain/Viral (Superfamily 1) RNA helicase
LEQKLEHPITGKLWMAAPEEELRRRVLDKLMKDFKYGEFLFKNQHWAKIGSDVAKLKVGNIRKFYYNNDQLWILENNKRGPYMMKFTDPEQIPNELKHSIISVDYNRAYTSICLQSRYKYYAFSITDAIEKFKHLQPGQKLKPGEYSLNKDVWWGHVFVQRGFWPYCVVQEMLSDGTISADDIGLQLIAKYVLPANLFEEWARYIYETFPKTEYENASKSMINMFMGLLNKKSIKYNEEAFCPSWKAALANINSMPNIKYRKMAEDNWFLTKTVETKLYSGHCFLWRMIICQQYILNHEMELKVMGKISKPSFNNLKRKDNQPRILGFTTDSMKVFRCPPEYKPTLKHNAKPGDLVVEDGPAKIRGSYIEDLEPQALYKYEEMKWTVMTSEELKANKCSAMVLGQGGAGKTHLLKELSLLDKDKKQRNLTYTNNAKNTLVTRGVDNVFTLASQKLSNEELNGIELIGFDEFTMVPEMDIGMIYHAWLKNPNLIVRLFGDEKQCKPQRDEKGIWYDYTKLKIVWEMTRGMKVELPYIPQSGRYDLATKQEIDYLKTNHRLSPNWVNMAEFEPNLNCCKYEFNIVPFAPQRTTVNKELFQFHSQGKEVVTLKSNGKEMPVFVGMPVISHDNYKKAGIINSKRYVITSIGQKIKMREIRMNILEDIESQTEYELDVERFLKVMRYGFADAVIRVQSATIKRPYNIKFLESMSLNQLNTAITRTTTLNDIGLKFCGKRFEWEIPPRRQVDVTPDKLNLKEVHIYQIYNKDESKIYTGQTYKSVQERFEEHKINQTGEKTEKWFAEEEELKIREVANRMVLTDDEADELEKFHIQSVPYEKNMNTIHRPKPPPPMIEVVEEIKVI